MGKFVQVARNAQPGLGSQLVTSFTDALSGMSKAGPVSALRAPSIMNPFKESASSPADLLADIAAFHERYGLTQRDAKVNVGEKPRQFSPEEWDLRHKRLNEEIDEYNMGVDADDDECTLDALVDLVYIALGTAYRRGWDFNEAWKRVHAANMAKERGEKHNSKYGSTFDIVKPEGWEPPTLRDLV